MHHTRGFDSIPYNHELLLSLQFREGTGTLTQDWAKPHHPMTCVGAPAWDTLDSGLGVLTFDGDDDEVQCPGANSADLDLTTENFTLAAWAYHDNMSTSRVIMNRGTLNTCGWEWYTANSNLALRTNQAASREGASGMGFIITDTWQFLVMVRTGLVGLAYLDGVAMFTSQTDNGLLDPVACGAHTFRVGNNPHDNYFEGDLWNTRIWPRVLSASEVQAIFEAERNLFGV